MKITAYKTEIVTAGSHNLQDLATTFLPKLEECSVIAVSSKVVALCEGRIVPIEGADKDKLIHQQASRYLPRTFDSYNVTFTIAHNMLVPTAGIDESNGNGAYVLWPEDPQASVNTLRRHLCEHFGLKHVGVVMTDSCMRPLRWGVTGIAVASSGFEAVKQCMGEPDLFGRPLQVTRESIQDGLAAAATVVMGEGAQQTPFAVIEDVPFVTFTGRDPTKEELDAEIIQPEDDLYAPFLAGAPWEQGDGKQK